MCARRLIGIAIRPAVSFVIALCVIYPFAQADTASPSATFDNLSHDFGVVRSSGPYRTTFHYRNSGNAPLVLRSIKRSCQCMNEMPASLILPPGQSGEIRVGYDLKATGWGTKSDSVAIETNDPRNPSITLLVRIDYRPPVELIPAKIELGPLKESTKTYAEFTIVTTMEDDSKNPTVPRFVCSDERLKIVPLDTVTEEPTLQRTYRLEFVPDGQPLKPSTVLIETQHPQIPRLELPVSAIQTMSIALTPPRALFGIVGVDEHKTVQIAITSQDAAVLTAICADQRIQSDITQMETPGQFQLTIHFKPNGDARELNANVELRNEDETLCGKVELLGFVKPH